MGVNQVNSTTFTVANVDEFAVTEDNSFNISGVADAEHKVGDTAPSLYIWYWTYDAGGDPFDPLNDDAIPLSNDPVAIDENGIWSFDADALGDGYYQFFVTDGRYGATWNSGHILTVTGGVTELQLDTTTPAPTIDSVLDDYWEVVRDGNGDPVLDGDGNPIPVPPEQEFVGQILSGQSTNDHMPTLSGTAEAYNVIHFYNGDQLLGYDDEGDFVPYETIANADGSWSFTFFPRLLGWEIDPVTGDPHEGFYDFRVEATDAAGHVGVSSSYQVNILDNAACFLKETLIATPTGERPIESLAIGDMITLADGRQKPVKWIGRMTVNLNRFNRRSASPILIRAGALGGGLPKRDLYTSYRHGFALDGVLVVAGLLVNGTSIVQCVDWEEPTVVYYHVEVEGHELMFAEGAEAETFAEIAEGREKFDNADQYQALYPDSRAAEPMKLGRVSFARQVPRAVRAFIQTAAVEMGYLAWAAAA
jgi:hypothetical protein